MPPPSVSSVVRTILTAQPALAADEVIKLAKARGVAASETAIRHSVHNLRSVLRKQPGATEPAPATARQTPAPATPAAPEPAPASSPADLGGVFANVTRVNALLGACGGAENVRRAAEAVRACGSVEAFLQHLELVAGIRSAGAPG